MGTYPKIQTLWFREEGTGKLMPGQYSDLIFPNIRKWHASEKINGTNMRVDYDVEIKNGNVHISNVEIAGKTDDAQIPPHLLKYMQATFTKESLQKMVRVKMDDEEEFIDETYHVTLYGEGYGSKIHRGENIYRKDVALILFDAKIGDYWIEPENVKDIANKLGISYVPELGIMSEEEIIKLVKEHYKSKIAENKEYAAEGIVARSHPMVLFRDGTPVMFKIKDRDYKKLAMGLSNEKNKEVKNE